jgi:hypothetical protein
MLSYIPSNPAHSVSETREDKSPLSDVGVVLKHPPIAFIADHCTVTSFPSVAPIPLLPIHLQIQETQPLPLRLLGMHHRHPQLKMHVKNVWLLFAR